MRIFSKFTTEKGVIRSLDDLQWTVKAYGEENPQIGIIGDDIFKMLKKNDFLKETEQKINIAKIVNKLKRIHLLNKKQKANEDLKEQGEEVKDNFQNYLISEEIEKEIQKKFDEMVGGTDEVEDDFTISEVNDKGKNSEMLNLRR